MKKYRILLITSFLSIILLMSCEDAYTIVQDGEFSENDITKLEDLQSYLNGAVYGSLSNSDEIAFTAIFTDETGVGNGNGGQSLDTHRFIINSGNAYADAIWTSQYYTINRVNRLLRIAESQVVPTSVAEQTKYDCIIAQAKAIRAFAYLQLLTYFSTDLKDDNALGVIVFTNVPGAADFYPRSENRVAFELIESDLQSAYDNLNYSTYPSTSPQNTTPYKYVSKSMIDALRARMYIYRGKYQLAKQYALQAISSSGVSLTQAGPITAGSTLAPLTPDTNIRTGSTYNAWKTLFYGTTASPSTTTPSPYKRMWNDLARGELIFSLDRPVGANLENIASRFTVNNTSASGSNLFELGRSLFNGLRSNPGDVRRWVFVDPTSFVDLNYATSPSPQNTDVLTIDKYPGKTGAILRNDIKVFRLSEMYFILAECLANEGNINGTTNSVSSVLKQIRDARNYINTNQPLPVYANATEAWVDILYERRLELCFEGHRYIDVKRLAPLTSKSIERDAVDDIISNDLTLPIGDYRFTLPIPLDEILANPVTQNPNY